MHNVNLQHSPLGAHASFTLGHPGPHGGLGIGLTGPAGQNVYIAVEDSPGAGTYRALPFFAADQDQDDPLASFQGGEAARPPVPAGPLTALPSSAVRRRFDAVTDRWTAGTLDFAVHSPLGTLPEPPDAGAADADARDADPSLRLALLPAVLAEFTVDNTGGDAPLRAFVGYAGSDPYSGMRRLDAGPGLTGVGEGLRTAIVTDAPGVQTAIGFDIPFLLGARGGEGSGDGFGLGQTALLVFEVPPGERRTHRLALCFHTAGQVTVPERCRYLYTRYYPDLESVAAAAFASFDPLLDRWRAAAVELGAGRLSPDRAAMLALAIRSYYGSTELLEDPEGRPVWVVNEGEFRMMNTLDLTVDQSFFEARQHPWTLRNVLDRQLRLYSYRDRFGLSFTHDMGVANVWSPHGTSSYERPGLSDCFSYMTGEQLLNWVIAAAVYEGTGEAAWSWCEHRADTLRDCLDSLLARDPDGVGVQTADSELVAGGAEITTYDSLDTSLGQARYSGYLAVKGWAAYRWLERTLRRLGDFEGARNAASRAERTIKTLTSAVRPDGTLPALLDDPGAPRIIPVVEGLALAHLTGTEVAAEPELTGLLATHLRAVLEEGRCLFPDGGWKLSETSDNSWLSKIYLCQFAARALLAVPDDAAMAAADRAHVRWLSHPTESRWSWSDQMIAGVAAGSRYYPRGVTAITWLSEV